MTGSERLAAAAVDAARACAEVAWPAAHAYHPLLYAETLWRAYVALGAPDRRRVLFLGMNPGPWGMAQTGVPFGEVATVRDWMGLRGVVTPPGGTHPKRPVEGLSCRRSEVSGRRLWGLIADRWPSAVAFLAEQIVVNWCPVLFLEASGRNLTPERLPAPARRRIETICDAWIAEAIAAIAPEVVVGVGGIAEQVLRRVAPPETAIVRILHPSPASPAANRGWAAAAEGALVEAGVWAPRAAGATPM